jgi:aldose sugar dehydrogenase
VLRHDARFVFERGWLIVRSLLLVLFVALIGSPAAAQRLTPVVVAKGLDHPWGLAFLADGRLLVTERAGRMRIVERDGRLNAPLAGVPPVVAAGQGGLLDVVLHPQFASNQLVYWTYSEAGDGGSATAVARGKLEGNALSNVQVIFRQSPKVSGGNNHFGSRLVWSRDGTLFVGLGDRFTRKDDAQTLDNHMGKVVRIDADGKAPADNPFASRAGARAEIWSTGHRNIQGAALHPTSGELWTVEHGPQGGDELNVPAAGANHGWPVITYGRNYGIGTKIGEGTERADIAPPLRHWIPSIAPSGMAFLTSDRYPGWKGNLFIGALRGSHLARLELDGRKVVKEEPLLAERNERIRDVRQGPDGWLYVMTDSPDGQIWRLER